MQGQITIQDFLRALQSAAGEEEEGQVVLDKMMSNYQRPKKTVYFVIQLPAGAQQYGELPITEPKIVSMDLWLQCDETAEDACDIYPFEQLRFFQQNPSQFEFYRVNDNQTVYTKFANNQELGDWLRNGQIVYDRLFAQPKNFKEMNMARIKELSGEWGYSSNFNPFG